MATIVRHRRTGNEYILLSINGEANKTNPSRFINELFNPEKTETSSSATVCDSQGNLFLAYIDDLVVTEIDGQKPADLLPEAPLSEPDPDRDYIPEPDRDFDDEELADEDFENSPSNGESLEIPASDSDNQNKSDFDEDDEDWI